MFKLNKRYDLRNIIDYERIKSIVKKTIIRFKKKNKII